MYAEADIISLIAKRLGIDETHIHSDTDIFLDLHCMGDDFHEMIGEYANIFQVDMSDYKWYFHANEEGWSFGGGFFKPPYKRVTRIPVTPEMLTRFANTGKWDIQYPEHTLPKYRYDILINFVLFISIIFFAIRSCIEK